MKFLTVLLVLALNAPAYADTLQIDCKVPDHLAGNAATLSGTLDVTKNPNDPYPTVTGTMKLFIGGSTQTPVINTEIEVKGSELDDGSITMGSTDHEEVGIIYINEENSYVEVNHSQFQSSCNVIQ